MGLKKHDKFNKKILDYKDDDLFILFYKDYCQYCEDALELLRSKDITHKAYNLNKISGGKTKVLTNLSNYSKITKFDKSHNTVPIIFYKGKFVGGYTDLKKLLQVKLKRSRSKSRSRSRSHRK